MNVFFHAVSSIGMASAASCILVNRFSDTDVKKPYLKSCAILFCVGVIWHGLLDIAPHQYPFRTLVDIAISITLFVLTCVLIKPKWLVLFGCSYVGHIFPDLIDLGPYMINRLTGLPIPVPTGKVFFWHTQPWSGSIYDGTRSFESHSYHLITCVLALAGLIYGWKHFRKTKPIP